jgi:hypothetical protein
MKLVIAALLAVILYEGYHSQDLQQQLAQSCADVDRLQAEFSEEHTISQTQATAAKSASLDRQQAQSELRTAQQLAADLRSKTEAALAHAADIEKKLDAAISDVEHFKQEAETAKKEAREAAKKALADRHNTCPPPEVIPKETQPQQYAPSYTRDDGRKTWLTSFDRAEAAAKKLNRLQLVAWGTRSCPHCDEFMRECSEQEVGKVIFTNYAPCWITVQDRETFDLAEKYGVNKFQYPGAMLLNVETGAYVLWRPSKDSGELVRQIQEKAEGLK